MKPCRVRSKGGRLSQFSIKPTHSKFSNISTFVNAEKKIYNLKTQMQQKCIGVKKCISDSGNICSVQ
jgi:hypothetical protein